jgi:uncharacterized protein YndB with AHSA1/START domain
MTTDTAAGTTTQVYRVFIDAKPQAIWDAITSPEWSQQYGYRGINDYELRPGGHFESRATEEFQAMGMPPVVVDGEVIEADPPHRLVHTWRFLWDELKTEGPTRVTFEIEEVDGGVCQLTVTHVLENAPLTAAQLAGEIEGAGGGWAYVLSDLKSLLETGKAMGCAD